MWLLAWGLRQVHTVVRGYPFPRITLHAIHLPAEPHSWWLLVCGVVSQKRKFSPLKSAPRARQPRAPTAGSSSKKRPSNRPGMRPAVTPSPARAMAGGARKRRRWSVEETEWLREGVARYGTGAWAQILDAYPFDVRGGFTQWKQKPSVLVLRWVWWLLNWRWLFTWMARWLDGWMAGLP